MDRTLRNLGPLCAAALVLALLPTGAAHAVVDCWLTDPGSTVAVPALPAGFFGLKNGSPSDPIAAQDIAVEGDPLPPGTCDCQTGTTVQWLDPHGNPVEPGDMHAVTYEVSEYDTCVERTGPTMPVDSPTTVDIEIVELSLRSVSPITVNYGPEPPSFFDVLITLDGAQSLGTMDFIPGASGSRGDLNLQDLPVDYQLDFEEIEGAGFQNISGLSLSFVNTRGTFGPFPVITIPSLTGWGLTLFALLVLALGIFWLRRHQTLRPAS